RLVRGAGRGWGAGADSLDRAEPGGVVRGGCETGGRDRRSAGLHLRQCAVGAAGRAQARDGVGLAAGARAVAMAAATGAAVVCGAGAAAGCSEPDSTSTVHVK